VLSLSGHFPASRFRDAESKKTPTRGAVFGVGFGFSGGGGVAVVCGGVAVVWRRWSAPDFGASELRRCSDDAVVLRRCSVFVVWRWRGGSVRCSAAATGTIAASAAPPRAARVRSKCCIDGYAARPAALRCTPITAINNYL